MTECEITLCEIKFSGGFKERIHNGNTSEHFPHIHDGEQPKDSHEELIGENLTEEIRPILEGNTSPDLLNEN